MKGQLARSQDVRKCSCNSSQDSEAGSLGKPGAGCAADKATLDRGTTGTLTEVEVGKVYEHAGGTFKQKSGQGLVKTGKESIGRFKVASQKPTLQGRVSSALFSLKHPLKALYPVQLTYPLPDRRSVNGFPASGDHNSGS